MDHDPKHSNSLVHEVAYRQDNLINSEEKSTGFLDAPQSTVMSSWRAACSMSSQIA